MTAHSQQNGEHKKKEEGGLEHHYVKSTKTATNINTSSSSHLSNPLSYSINKIQEPTQHHAQQQQHRQVATTKAKTTATTTTVTANENANYYQNP